MLLVRERMGISLTWLLTGRQANGIHEEILRQYPGENAERLERLFRNLVRLYQ